MTLLGFVFNTLQERVNLPIIDGKRNSNYLPDLLVGFDDPDRPGQKLLPLTGQAWNVGMIAGAQGRTISEPIATWYANYLTAQEGLDPESTVAIPDPEHPDPSLALDAVSVVGLQNAFLLPDPTIQSGEQGYVLTLTLALNRVESLPRVQIAGGFLLVQAVCRRDPSSPDGVDVCGGYDQTIEGTGAFAVNVEDALIDVEVFLSPTGSDPQRTLRLEVRSVALRGEKNDNPDFTVEILSITKAPPGLEKIWVRLAENAFGAPEAKTAVLANLRATLNSERTRAGLAKTFLGQVESLLTRVFGVAPTGGLPGDEQQRVENPVDLYLLDRLRVAMNAPTGPWYLPTILCKSKKPALEPYSADTIDLGSLSVGGLPWDANSLTGVLVTALSNSIAPPDQITCREGILRVTSTQGQLVTPPPDVPRGPLKMTGDFSLRPTGMDPIVGAFQTVIDASQLQIVAHASGDRVETLLITLSGLSIIFEDDKMVIDLALPAEGGLGSIASGLVKTAKVKGMIRDKLNAKLSSAETLEGIGAEVTKLAQGVILSHLMGEE